ncbi:hypothetical protein R1sor_010928 [Riccia sorocarpa]|uniref:MULE transposase domain-containing protein n=1 Tax=Riccia sorocarpa TaxID=122646 RepID=A0ABD3I352_9MARC
MILYEDNDEFQAISFLIPLKRHVSSVKEVLTDSTFKTNDMRFEMFALIGNLDCFGVPLCYMFYLKKSSRRVYALHFFITDKDAGQIEDAQRSMPEMLVQLSLKHCLDAVERRMVAIEKGTNPYDGSAAHDIFLFIDSAWGPSVGDIVT